MALVVDDTGVVGVVVGAVVVGVVVGVVVVGVVVVGVVGVVGVVVVVVGQHSHWTAKVSIATRLVPIESRLVLTIQNSVPSVQGWQTREFGSPFAALQGMPAES